MLNCISTVMILERKVHLMGSGKTVQQQNTWWMIGEGCLLLLFCSIFKCMTDRCSFQPSNGENLSLSQFIFESSRVGTGPSVRCRTGSGGPGHSVHRSGDEEEVITYQTRPGQNPGPGWSSWRCEHMYCFIEMMRLIIKILSSVLLARLFIWTM